MTQEEDTTQMHDLEQAYLEAVKIREKLFLEVIRAKKALDKAELAHNSAVMAASTALDKVNGKQNGGGGQFKRHVIDSVRALSKDLESAEPVDNSWRPNLGVY